MTNSNHQQQHTLSEDGLRLFYRDYPSNSSLLPAVCLPGLTRNSRDFEDLAAHLATQRRVLSLDFRGRGYSDHDPQFQHYQPPTYARDTLRVMDHAGIDRAVFIGTSLGGLVSMIVGRDCPQRLAGVVLNDIGPEIDPAGLKRIQQYTGTLEPVTSWAEAAAQSRRIYEYAWPGLSDAQWDIVARRSYRESEDGTPVLDMDPNIGRAIREVPLDLGDPWDLFAALQPIPTLLLRGASSDILAPATVIGMREVKPDLTVVEVPNRGHVPLLDEPASLSAIDQLLASLL